MSLRLLLVPAQQLPQDNHARRQTQSELLPIHPMTRWKMKEKMFFQLLAPHSR
jgi:hypothetical protein